MGKAPLLGCVLLPCQANSLTFGGLIRKPQVRSQKVVQSLGKMPQGLEGRPLRSNGFSAQRHARRGVGEPQAWRKAAGAASNRGV